MTKGNEGVQQGSCFCGMVRFTLSGSPVAMGYCHCESCRRWSAAPVNAFTLWQPEALELQQAAHLVDTYSKTPRSFRSWCKSCGGHVFSRHPGLGVILAYAAVIPGLAFTPALHLNYSECRVRLRDGLPKFRDFPKEFGGTGLMVPE